MKSFLTACLIALSLPALGNDFDNWYFNFLTGRVLPEVTIFKDSAEGKKWKKAMTKDPMGDGLQFEAYFFPADLEMKNAPKGKNRLANCQHFPLPSYLLEQWQFYLVQVLWESPHQGQRPRFGDLVLLLLAGETP